MGTIIVITHRAGMIGSEELLQLKTNIRYKLVTNEFRGWKKKVAVSLLNLTLLLPDFTTNKILSSTSQGDYQGKTS